MSYITNLAISFPGIATNGVVGYGAAYVGGSLLIGGAKLWINIKGLKDAHGLPIRVHDLLPVFGTPKFRRQLALAGLVFSATKVLLNRLAQISDPDFFNAYRDKFQIPHPASVMKLRFWEVFSIGVSAATACLAVSLIDPSSTRLRGFVYALTATALLQIGFYYKHYSPNAT